MAIRDNKVVLIYDVETGEWWSVFRDLLEQKQYGDLIDNTWQIVSRPKLDNYESFSLIGSQFKNDPVSLKKAKDEIEEIYKQDLIKITSVREKFDSISKDHAHFSRKIWNLVDRGSLLEEE